MEQLVSLTPYKANSTLKSDERRVIESSAPSKAIFFGEHSVVYGKPAIAMALKLRTVIRAELVGTGCANTLSSTPISTPNLASFSSFPKFKTSLLFGIGIRPFEYELNGDACVVAFIENSAIISLNELLLKFSFEKQASFLDPLFWKQESANLKLFLETFLKSVSFVKGSNLFNSGILSILFFSALFLSPFLVQEQNLFENMSKNLHNSATKKFFSHLNSSFSARSIVFKILSQLPIGAGLGSSASFGVALTSAVLSLLPGEYVNDSSVYYWSNVSETIIHGTSSGLDPSVSLLGGSICFTKNIDVIREVVASSDRCRQNLTPRLTLENDSVVIPFVFDCESFSLAIFYSGLPRRTIDMVTRVKEFKNSNENAFAEVLNGIEIVCKEALSLFLKENGTDFLPRLSSLICKNQSLLTQSNPNGLDVDTVEFHLLRSKIETAGTFPISIPFASKITGAGGGGCALYLFSSDSNREIFIRQVAEAKLLSDPYPIIFPVDIDPNGVIVKKIVD